MIKMSNPIARLLEIVHEARQATAKYLKQSEGTEIGVVIVDFDERLQQWENEVKAHVSQE